MNILKVYKDLFFVFFKIGAFTFGGGWAMISIIEKEVVEKRKWLDKEEFIDALAVAQSLPGILAVNISIFTGNKHAGINGALAATLGTVLPSFMMILAIALFFTQIYHEPYMIAIFNGIRPAVVALIVIPVITTAKSSKITWRNCWIPIVASLLIWLIGISPIYIILGAATLAFIQKFIKRK